MYFPEFKDFERLATSGVRAVPVMREVVLDVTGVGVPVDFMTAAGRCYSSSRFARH